MADKKLISGKNYITIQGWMVTELGLKGNELIIYSVIYGFSQNEGQRFCGSTKYLEEWTNSTKKGVLNSLKSLCDKGLLKKEEEGRGSQKKCYYTALYGDEVQEETDTPEKPDEKQDEKQEEKQDDKVRDKYKEYISKIITPIEDDKLSEFTQSVGEDVVLCAISEAVLCRCTKPKYLFAILERCKKDGVKSKMTFYESLEKHQTSENKTSENKNGKKTTFNDYEQRSYDCDELEEIIRRKNESKREKSTVSA